MMLYNILGHFCRLHKFTSTLFNQKNVLLFLASSGLFLTFFQYIRSSSYMAKSVDIIGPKMGVNKRFDKSKMDGKKS